jgi:hypothetical protein
MLVSRETLYDEIWAEPITVVSARYSVSGSYLARICRDLKVPCPPRGYWAAQKAGKRVRKPPLPPAEPGAALDWARGSMPSRRAPLDPNARPKPKRRFGPRPTEHDLVVGVKDAFTISWQPRDSGYLRPRKRLLPDVFCSPSILEQALKTASEIYLGLEDAGYRVGYGSGRRPAVDHRGHPGARIRRRSAQPRPAVQRRPDGDRFRRSWADGPRLSRTSRGPFGDIAPE